MLGEWYHEWLEESRRRGATVMSSYWEDSMFEYVKGFTIKGFSVKLVSVSARAVCWYVKTNGKEKGDGTFMTSLLSLSLIGVCIWSTCLG
jgi:hypothetical protein